MFIGFAIVQGQQTWIVHNEDIEVVKEVLDDWCNNNGYEVAFIQEVIHFRTGV